MRLSRTEQDNNERSHDADPFKSSSRGHAASFFCLLQSCEQSLTQTPAPALAPDVEYFLYTHWLYSLQGSVAIKGRVGGATIAGERGPHIKMASTKFGVPLFHCIRFECVRVYVFVCAVRQ